MSPEKKVADEEGSPKNDSTKRQEVTGNDNNHDEDDVASDISSNSSLGFEDDEEVGAKNKIGVNRIVPDYTSDVSSDDLSGRICVKCEMVANLDVREGWEIVGFVYFHTFIMNS